MDRRYFVFGAAALAPAYLSGLAPANAEPAFKRLLPLLGDLPGWTGEKPDGMTMDVGEGAMTTAERKYSKGDATLDVAVVTGPSAAGALGPINSGMKVETSDGHMLPGVIDGFKVLKTYNNNDKSGALMVALDKAVVLTFGYSGVGEDEAVGLARKLNWKALAAATK
jgi:hypothetical protein